MQCLNFSSHKSVLCASESEKWIHFTPPQPLSASELGLAQVSAEAFLLHSLCGETIRLRQRNGKEIKSLKFEPISASSEQEFMEEMNSQTSELAVRFEVGGANDAVNVSWPSSVHGLQLSAGLASICSLPTWLTSPTHRVQGGRFDLIRPFRKLALICAQLQTTHFAANQTNLPLLGIITLAESPLDDRPLFLRSIASWSPNVLPSITQTSTTSVDRLSFSLRSVSAPNVAPCLRSLNLSILLHVI